MNYVFLNHLVAHFVEEKKVYYKIPIQKLAVFSLHQFCFLFYKRKCETCFTNKFNIEKKEKCFYLLLCILDMFVLVVKNVVHFHREYGIRFHFIQSFIKNALKAANMKKKLKI